MRIAIVNDNRVAVEVLSRVVRSIPGSSIAWIAWNGREAVEKCLQDRPDLVLMDLLMPVLDGVGATRQIMATAPCGILVVTATVAGNAALAFEALSAGALDAVATPALGPSGSLDGASEIVRKIRTMARILSFPVPRGAGCEPGWIAIGASTGGPGAVASILRALPSTLTARVVIVQHLDGGFIPALAEWFGHASALPVEVARRGCHPEPGVVYLAGGEGHLILQSGRTFDYSPEPADSEYRPSIDVFFKSLGRYAAAGGAAALLTGMGRDGAEGLLALRNLGWHTVAQDRHSSVVFGMPKAAIEIGGAVEVLPLDRIPASLLTIHQPE